MKVRALVLVDVRLIQVLALQRPTQAVNLPRVVDVHCEVVRPTCAEESALAVPVRLGRNSPGMTALRLTSETSMFV